MTAHDVFRDGQFIGIRGRLKKALLSHAFRQIDLIHAVSRGGRDNFSEFFPVLQRNDCALLSMAWMWSLSGWRRNLRQQIGPAADNVYIIGFFGRFMAQKGFRYLVDAIDLVVSRGVVARRPLVLTFGSGGYFREEYARLRSMGLGDYFMRMPHAENMPGVVKGVDLVAMPSLWEACGLLGMEALVAGVPIVGTSCIGLDEVLSGTPAAIVPPGDAQALASSIEHEMSVNRRPEFVAYMPEAARRFAPDNMVTNLMQLYRSMASP
jgi:glycosyltransferase involved in cell wall biosynthesis